MEFHWETREWNLRKFIHFFEDIKAVKTIKDLSGNLLKPSQIQYLESGCGTPMNLRVIFDGKDKGARSLTHYPSTFWAANPQRLTALLVSIADVIGVLHRNDIIYRMFDPAFFYITGAGHLQLFPIGMSPAPRDETPHPHIHNPQLAAVVLDPVLKVREEDRVDGAGEYSFSVASDLAQFGLMIIQLLLGHRWTFPGSIREASSGEVAHLRFDPDDGTGKAFSEILTGLIPDSPAVFRNMLVHCIFRMLHLTASPYLSFTEVRTDLTILHSLAKAGDWTSPERAIDFLSEMCVGRRDQALAVQAFLGLPVVEDAAVELPEVGLGSTSEADGRGSGSTDRDPDDANDPNDGDTETQTDPATEDEGSPNWSGADTTESDGDAEGAPATLQAGCQLALINAGHGMGVSRFLRLISHAANDTGNLMVLTCTPDRTSAVPESLLTGLLESASQTELFDAVWPHITPSAQIAIRLAVPHLKKTLVAGKVPAPGPHCPPPPRDATHATLELAKACTATAARLMIVIDDAQELSADELGLLNTIVTEDRDVAVVLGLVQVGAQGSRPTRLPRRLRALYQGVVALTHKVIHDPTRYLHVNLPPLTADDIADAFRRVDVASVDKKDGIVKAMREACGGSPALLHKLLRALIGMSAITYHHPTRRWIIQGNAVEQLRKHVANKRGSGGEGVALPPKGSVTFRVLSRAALIWSPFTVDDLRRYFHKTRLKSDRGLDDENRVSCICATLRHQGVLRDATTPAEEEGFAFASQAVREKVISMVPAGELAQARYHLGMYVHKLVKRPPPGYSVRLGEHHVLSYFNKADALVTKDETRVRLSVMNYMVGLKALEVAAFDAALHYFLSGLKFLSTVKGLPDRYQSMPWDHSVGVIECSMMLGLHTEACRWLDTATRYASSSSQKLYLAVRRMRLLTAQGRPATAFREAVGSLTDGGLLTQIGVTADPGRAVQDQLKSLGDATPDSLRSRRVALPTAENVPITLALLQIFETCILEGRLQTGLYYLLEIIHHNTMKGGQDSAPLTPEVLVCWVVHAGIKLWRGGNAQTSLKLAKAAMEKLAGDHNLAKYHRLATSMHIRFTLVYRRPVDHCILKLERAIAGALEQHKIVEAGRLQYERFVLIFFRGGDLRDALTEGGSAAITLGQLRARVFTRPALILLQLIHNLTFDTDAPTIAAGGEYTDIASALHDIKDLSEARVSAFTASLGLQLAYLLAGEYGKAARGLAVLSDGFDLALCSGLVPHFLLVVNATRIIVNDHHPTACLDGIEALRNIVSGGACSSVDAALSGIHVLMCGGSIPRALAMLADAAGLEPQPMWRALIDLVQTHCLIQSGDRAAAQAVAERVNTALLEINAITAARATADVLDDLFPSEPVPFPISTFPVDLAAIDFPLNMEPVPPTPFVDAGQSGAWEWDVSRPAPAQGHSLAMSSAPPDSDAASLLDSLAGPMEGAGSVMSDEAMSFVSDSMSGSLVNVF